MTRRLTQNQKNAAALAIAAIAATGPAPMTPAEIQYITESHGTRIDADSLELWLASLAAAGLLTYHTLAGATLTRYTLPPHMTQTEAIVRIARY